MPAQAGRIDRNQRNECQRHAQQVEEQGCGVGQRGFDQREGRSPDQHDRQQQQVRGERAGVMVCLGHLGPGGSLLSGELRDVSE
jgi:hypothetical protein